MPCRRFTSLFCLILFPASIAFSASPDGRCMDSSVFLPARQYDYSCPDGGGLRICMSGDTKSAVDPGKPGSDFIGTRIFFARYSNAAAVTRCVSSLGLDSVAIQMDGSALVWRQFMQDPRDSKVHVLFEKRYTLDLAVCSTKIVAKALPFDSRSASRLFNELSSETEYYTSQRFRIASRCQALYLLAYMDLNNPKRMTEMIDSVRATLPPWNDDGPGGETIEEIEIALYLLEN